MASQDQPAGRQEPPRSSWEEGSPAGSVPQTRGIPKVPRAGQRRERSPGTAALSGRAAPRDPSSTVGKWSGAGEGGEPNSHPSGAPRAGPAWQPRKSLPPAQGPSRAALRSQLVEGRVGGGAAGEPLDQSERPPALPLPLATGEGQLSKITRAPRGGGGGGKRAVRASRQHGAFQYVMRYAQPRPPFSLAFSPLLQRACVEGRGKELKADDEENLGGEGGDPLCNASDGDRMPGERRFVRTAMGNGGGGKRADPPNLAGGGAGERRKDGVAKTPRDRTTRAIPALQGDPPRPAAGAPVPYLRGGGSGGGGAPEGVHRGEVLGLGRGGRAAPGGGVVVSGEALIHLPRGRRQEAAAARGSPGSQDEGQAGPASGRAAGRECRRRRRRREVGLAKLPPKWPLLLPPPPAASAWGGDGGRPERREARPVLDPRVAAAGHRRWKRPLKSGRSAPASDSAAPAKPGASAQMAAATGMRAKRGVRRRGPSQLRLRRGSKSYE